MRKKFLIIPLACFFICSTIKADTKNGYSLQQLIEIGLENSPLIAAQVQEVNARHAAYKAAKRLTNPELSFTWGEGGILR